MMIAITVPIITFLVGVLIEKDRHRKEIDAIRCEHLKETFKLRTEINHLNRIKSGEKS